MIALVFASLPPDGPERRRARKDRRRSFWRQVMMLVCIVLAFGLYLLQWIAGGDLLPFSIPTGGLLP